MSNYRISKSRTYMVDEDGQQVPLANFAAKIVRETRTIDGMKTDTVLTIQGTQLQIDQTKNPPEEQIVRLPEITIDANEFPSFTWVLKFWGSRCVIYPGGSAKENLKTAIQLDSTPEIKEIYGTMGWQSDKSGSKIYLHAGGAITTDGNDSNVTVSLPPELRRYNFSDQEPGCDLYEAWETSLKLLELAPEKITFPLWAATFAPILGPVDFAVHLTGRSGTFKSEITSLFQAHFGGTIDARHLPASWSSTANALEAQAYFAANAPMVVDDFVPVGTSYQVKAYQTSADRLIRGQGNQAGRARLSDAASFKSAYYPRGLLMSTGEDTPEGHSVRARMLILELSPGDVNVQVLTAEQKKRAQLPILMQAFIQDVSRTVAPSIDKHGQAMSPDLVNRVHEVRDLLIEIGHSRTPPMLARLIASAEAVFQWAAERDLITEEQAQDWSDRATAAIIEAGNNQSGYLETADPVSILTGGIRQALNGLKAHIRSMSGGVPVQPDQLGWVQVSTSGEMPKYKAGGPCIGWIDRDDDVLYLEPDLAYAAAKKETGNDLSITKGTAWKRLKDAGMLVRTDGARQRNTVRITADGHGRNVLALTASEFFQTQEVTSDDNEERTEDDASE